MSLEMSDRDKTLIYVIVIFAILGAAYYFGFRNFSAQKESYKAEAASYDEEYSTLIELQKNRKQYTEDTERFETERANELTAFEDGYNQENFIKTMSDIEKASDVWLQSMKFDPQELLYQFSTEEGLNGYGNTTTMSFQGEYTGFKTFLASVLAINSKTVINTMNAKYDKESGIVICDLKVTHYSVGSIISTGPDVTIDMPAGISNIFDSDMVVSTTQSEASNADYILTDYDLCVVISPDNATIDSVIVGTTNDDGAKDSLSTDENATAELTITIDGSDGKYTVSYKLGDETYPSKNYEKGVSFKPGDTLDLLVASSIRDGKNDKVAVKANLINNSDMKLNVLVSGDDPSSPRFSAVTREGDIMIYR